MVSVNIRSDEHAGNIYPSYYVVVAAMMKMIIIIMNNFTFVVFPPKPITTVYSREEDQTNWS